MKILFDTSVLVAAISNIVGGVIYDAVILYTAFKVEIDRIVTLNKRDFVRIYPGIADKIILP
jgi:predicted nucleic acid-binding protein